MGRQDTLAQVQRLDVYPQLDAAPLDDVRELVERVQHRTGRRPLSDQLWLDLVQGDSASTSAVVTRDGMRITGYCQISAGNNGWIFEVVTDQESSPTELLVGAACSLVAAHGGGDVSWWVVDPTARTHSVAERHGLHAARTLHQMRVPLPLVDTPVDPLVDLRPFRVGHDEAEWLLVNNAAFYTHPEQGAWTLEAVRQREQQDWFDPKGFLLHYRDHRLAGFCWTKVDRDADPPLGEIYVVAVHPEFHGLGLGKALTVAGLAYLASQGVDTGMLYVDEHNTAAFNLYQRLGFTVHRTDCAYVGSILAEAVNTGETAAAGLPRWNVTDVHESLTSRSLLAAVERSDADVTRLISLFDEHGIRQIEARPVTADDLVAVDAVVGAYNDAALALGHLRSYVFASVGTDTRNEHAQALASQVNDIGARVGPLLARLADWVNALDPLELARGSQLATDHLGPLQHLAKRSEFQMAEEEETLYAQLATTGSSAWHRLHRDITSQLSTEVELPGGTVRLAMPAVRGLATHPDPHVRLAALAAERRAWPQVGTASAAALNSIKGEANAVNDRRGWASPLDASLYANNVSRPTFDAMQASIDACLPRLRGWMRTKASLHGHDGPLPWSDLFAPVRASGDRVEWQHGVDVVRNAFASYSTPLARLVDRALDERWIDAAPRDGKVGGASCTPFVDDRSLVLLNWDRSLSGVQTIAHELGHAYHNTRLAHRTPLQRRLPMALAETASIFCETLVVEAGLAHAQGGELLALLDVGLQGSLQVVVDIRSRLLFESEVFARRQRRTLGVAELDALMVQAQHDAYGDGLDHSTALASMWIVKGHYYSSHFYNWPYTFGLLFGLGLFARYRDDAERFLSGYDDLLSRAGMNTAEELGALFGLDITSEAFWTASLDVIGDRISRYEVLARSDHSSAGEG